MVADLVLGAVGVGGQLIAGCVKCYQLYNTATGYPTDVEHLRLRIKMEEYRFLHWLELTGYANGELLPSIEKQKGVIDMILYSKKDLMLTCGKAQDRYPHLKAEFQVGPAVELTPAQAAIVDRSTPRFPARDKFERIRSTLLEKGKGLKSQAGELPSRIKWAVCDRENLTRLVDQIALSNAFLAGLLEEQFQRELADELKLMRDELIVSNNKLDKLLTIVDASSDTGSTTLEIVQQANFPAIQQALQVIADQNTAIINRQQAETAINNEFYRMLALQLTQSFSQQGKGLRVFENAQIAMHHPGISRSVTPTPGQWAEFEAGSNRPGNNQLERDHLGLKHMKDYASLKAIGTAIVDKINLSDEDQRKLQIPAGDMAAVLDPVINREWVFETGDIEVARSNTRGMGYYQEVGKQRINIILEKKPYENFSNTGPRDFVKKRAKDLAALLHATKVPELRVLDCLGYYHDLKNSRYVFVYRSPSKLRSPGYPKTLLELMEDKDAPVPSLTQRFTLARRLANCLYRLHLAGWMHKGLRSSNVLFFTDNTKKREGGNVREDISVPFLAGFEYSRRDVSGEETEKPPIHDYNDLYRHHHALGDSVSTGFQKEYDIYSLGIVLFEVACWKPIGEILGIPKEEQHSNSTMSKTGKPTKRDWHQKVRRGLHEVLLSPDQRYYSEVKSRMGDTYAKVVEACLTGLRSLELQEDDDDYMMLDPPDIHINGQSCGGAQELQTAFQTEVIRKLGDLKV